MSATWLEQKDDGVLIRVQVQPGASKTLIVGIHGDRLKVRIAAPPVDGAANEELLVFLKKKIKIRGISLELVRGATSKMKDILCVGARVGEIEHQLFRASKP